MASRNPVVTNYFNILDFVSSKSETITNLMKDSQNEEWNYMLIAKNISHSDLINAGKRNGPNESIEKNYLYYLTYDEMREIEKVRKKDFEDAKQSNIFVPSDFYNFLGIKQLERRDGAQTTQHEHPIINDYADVFLVNDTMKYFTMNYTKKVFDNLNKKPNWNYDEYKVNFSDGKFTPIQISHAIHGIGTSNDIEFHKLRRTIFKNDSMYLLLRKNSDETKKEVYIMLEKNPRFFTIIGEANSTWEKFLNQSKNQELYKLLKRDNLSEEEKRKTRKNQNKWRRMLAEEMMNYTPTENEVFCPLTYITADFNNAGTLFRASHIKEYSECDINEAFDINNGILMVANADALFDKHLITIDEDGNIIFSYLIENDYKLKQELRLTEKVFKPILNSKREEYLKFHRAEFLRKEDERKSGDVDDTDYSLEDDLD